MYTLVPVHASLGQTLARAYRAAPRPPPPPKSITVCRADEDKTRSHATTTSTPASSPVLTASSPPAPERSNIPQAPSAETLRGRAKFDAMGAELKEMRESLSRIPPRISRTPEFAARRSKTNKMLDWALRNVCQEEFEQIKEEYRDAAVAATVRNIEDVLEHCRHEQALSARVIADGTKLVAQYEFRLDSWQVAIHEHNVKASEGRRTATMRPAHAGKTQETAASYRHASSTARTDTVRSAPPASTSAATVHRASATAPRRPAATVGPSSSRFLGHLHKATEAATSDPFRSGDEQGTSTHILRSRRRRNPRPATVRPLEDRGDAPRTSRKEDPRSDPTTVSTTATTTASKAVTTTVSDKRGSDRETPTMSSLAPLLSAIAVPIPGLATTALASPALLRTEYLQVLQKELEQMDAVRLSFPTPTADTTDHPATVAAKEIAIVRHHFRSLEHQQAQKDLQPETTDCASPTVHEPNTIRQQDTRSSGLLVQETARSLQGERILEEIERGTSIPDSPLTSGVSSADLSVTDKWEAKRAALRKQVADGGSPSSALASSTSSPLLSGLKSPALSRPSSPFSPRSSRPSPGPPLRRSSFTPLLLSPRLTQSPSPLASPNFSPLPSPVVRRAALNPSTPTPIPYSTTPVPIIQPPPPPRFNRPPAVRSSLSVSSTASSSPSSSPSNSPPASPPPPPPARPSSKGLTTPPRSDSVASPRSIFETPPRVQPPTMDLDATPKATSEEKLKKSKPPKQAPFTRRPIPSYDAPADVFNEASRPIAPAREREHGAEAHLASDALGVWDDVTADEQSAISATAGTSTTMSQTALGLSTNNTAVEDDAGATLRPHRSIQNNVLPNPVIVLEAGSATTNSAADIAHPQHSHSVSSPTDSCTASDSPVPPSPTVTETASCADYEDNHVLAVASLLWAVSIHDVPEVGPPPIAEAFSPALSFEAQEATEHTPNPFVPIITDAAVSLREFIHSPSIQEGEFQAHVDSTVETEVETTAVAAPAPVANEEPELLLSTLADILSPASTSPPTIEVVENAVDDVSAVEYAVQDVSEASHDTAESSTVAEVHESVATAQAIDPAADAENAVNVELSNVAVHADETALAAEDNLFLAAYLDHIAPAETPNTAAGHYPVEHPNIVDAPSAELSEPTLTPTTEPSTIDPLPRVEPPHLVASLTSFPTSNFYPFHDTHSALPSTSPAVPEAPPQDTSPGFLAQQHRSSFDTLAQLPPSFTQNPHQQPLYFPAPEYAPQHATDWSQQYGSEGTTPVHQAPAPHQPDVEMEDVSAAQPPDTPVVLEQFDLGQQLANLPQLIAQQMTYPQHSATATENHLLDPSVFRRHWSQPVAESFFPLQTMQQELMADMIANFTNAPFANALQHDPALPGPSTADVAPTFDQELRHVQNLAHRIPDPVDYTTGKGKGRSEPPQTSFPVQYDEARGIKPLPHRKEPVVPAQHYSTASDYVPPPAAAPPTEDLPTQEEIETQLLAAIENDDWSNSFDYNAMKTHSLQQSVAPAAVEPPTTALAAGSVDPSLLKLSTPPPPPAPTLMPLSPRRTKELPRREVYIQPAAFTQEVGLEEKKHQPVTANVVFVPLPSANAPNPDAEFDPEYLKLQAELAAAQLPCEHDPDFDSDSEEEFEADEPITGSWNQPTAAAVPKTPEPSIWGQWPAAPAENFVLSPCSSQRDREVLMSHPLPPDSDEEDNMDEDGRESQAFTPNDTSFAHNDMSYQDYGERSGVYSPHAPSRSPYVQFKVNPNAAQNRIPTPVSSPHPHRTSARATPIWDPAIGPIPDTVYEVTSPLPAEMDDPWERMMDAQSVPDAETPDDNHDMGHQYDLNENATVLPLITRDASDIVGELQALIASLWDGTNTATQRQIHVRLAYLAGRTQLLKVDPNLRQFLLVTPDDDDGLDPEDDYVSSPDQDAVAECVYEVLQAMALTELPVTPTQSHSQFPQPGPGLQGASITPDVDNVVANPSATEGSIVPPLEEPAFGLPEGLDPRFAEIWKDGRAAGMTVEDLTEMCTFTAQQVDNAPHDSGSAPRETQVGKSNSFYVAMPQPMGSSTPALESSAFSPTASTTAPLTPWGQTPDAEEVARSPFFPSDQVQAVSPSEPPVQFQDMVTPAASPSNSPVLNPLLTAPKSGTLTLESNITGVASPKRSSDEEGADLQGPLKRLCTPEASGSSGSSHATSPSPAPRTLPSVHDDMDIDDTTTPPVIDTHPAGQRPSTPSPSSNVPHNGGKVGNMVNMFNAISRASLSPTGSPNATVRFERSTASADVPSDVTRVVTLPPAPTPPVPQPRVAAPPAPQITIPPPHILGLPPRPPSPTKFRGRAAKDLGVIKPKPPRKNPSGSPTELTPDVTLAHSAPPSRPPSQASNPAAAQVPPRIPRAGARPPASAENFLEKPSTSKYNQQVRTAHYNRPLQMRHNPPPTPIPGGQPAPLPAERAERQPGSSVAVDDYFMDTGSPGPAVGNATAGPSRNAPHRGRGMGKPRWK